MENTCETPTAEGVIYPSGSWDFQGYLYALSARLKGLETEARERMERTGNRQSGSEGM